MASVLRDTVRLSLPVISDELTLKPFPAALSPEVYLLYTGEADVYTCPELFSLTEKSKMKDIAVFGQGWTRRSVLCCTASNAKFTNRVDRIW